MEWLIAWVSANAYGLAFAIGVLAILVVAVIFHRGIVDLAVRAEREACASIAEALHISERGDWSAGARCMRDRVASAIRARELHRPLRSYPRITWQDGGEIERERTNGPGSRRTS